MSHSKVPSSVHGMEYGDRFVFILALFILLVIIGIAFMY